MSEDKDAIIETIKANVESLIENNINIENAKEFAVKADEAIEKLEPSVYKQGLASLLNYVLASSNTETKRA